jgi:hypothetical protein
MRLGCRPSSEQPFPATRCGNSIGNPGGGTLSWRGVSSAVSGWRRGRSSVLRTPFIWIPLVLVPGFTVFNFTITTSRGAVLPASRAAARASSVLRAKADALTDLRAARLRLARREPRAAHGLVPRRRGSAIARRDRTPVVCGAASDSLSGPDPAATESRP